MTDPQPEPGTTTPESTKPRSVSTSAKVACNLADLLRAFIWGKPRVDERGNILQVERALAVVRGLAILGLIPLLFFGGIAAYCGTSCGDGTALKILRGASIALLAAAAAYSAGAIFGFLFGMPRWTDASSGVAPGSANDQKPRATAAQSPPAAGQDTQSNASGRVRPNTGLERVMDWLTTLIVGLGLVHIRTAVEYGQSISGWVTAAIVDAGNASPDANVAPGAAILIPYFIAGFFLVYLWAQRYMGRELLMADLESNAAIFAVIEAKQKETMNAMANVAEQMLYRPAEPAEGAQPVGGRPGGPMVPPGPLAGIDPAIVADIAGRYARSSDYFDEPIMAFGAQEANGRRLDADVVRMAGKMNLFRITLRVRSLDPQQRPMAGPVVFFLHHTFSEPYRAVNVIDGVATLTLVSAGSFIAGAAIAGEPTRLALDLAKLPGVPQDFVEN